MPDESSAAALWIQRHPQWVLVITITAIIGGYIGWRVYEDRPTPTFVAVVRQDLDIHNQYAPFDEKIVPKNSLVTIVCQVSNSDSSVGAYGALSSNRYFLLASFQIEQIPAMRLPECTPIGAPHTNESTAYFAQHAEDVQ
jgi:hypothetical protein